MKPIYLFQLSFLLSANFLSAQSQEKTQLPFTANYSSKIEIGEHKHVKIVQDIWKDWDNNTLSNSHALFDDSVMVLLSSGQVIQGKANLLLSRANARESIQTVKSTMDVWIPIYITDKKEWWVSIWASQNIVRKDASKTTILINELWRINNNGKVGMIRQYKGAMPGTIEK